MRTAPPNDPAEDSIGDLFHQLVDEGGKAVRAEVELYKEIARHRAAKARAGLVALAIGGTLLWDALIVLLIMLAEGLAVEIGPVAAGLIVAAAAAIPGLLLLRFGIRRMSVLGGDEEERAALREAERGP